MTARIVVQRLAAQPVSEGAGVRVWRSIGTPALRHLDPFLLLDYFGSDNPQDYIAGFPDHPHRGFVTFTHMLDGRMLHRDSLGNAGELTAGGAQWMKAAAGIIHSEMPRQERGLLRGFQLWINLPAAEKMSEPAYRDVGAEAIPAITSAGCKVRVLIGAYQDRRAPVVDAHTEVSYLEVELAAGGRFEHRLPSTHTAFAYVYEGEAVLAGSRLTPHLLAVLSPGDEVCVEAGQAGTRFILVSGRPLGEPVVQYGPFVMNTREEIEQALRDFRAGTLVRSAARKGSD